MKLKTYHARSLEAAMRLARIELGEQALFLGSAEDGAAASDKRFRATFALEEAGDDPSESPGAARGATRPSWARYVERGEQTRGPAAAPAAAARAERVPEAANPRSLERVREEIRELRRELATRAAGPAAASPSPLRHSRLAVLYDRMTAAGVGPREALELLGPLEAEADAGAGLGGLESALRERMKAGWETASDDDRGCIGAVLVGPSGAGKTSAAARLAVRWGGAGRRPVWLINVDQLRVGAVEPLEAYAGLLGAELEVVDDPESLAGAVREAAASDIDVRVVVDTPGYAPGERPRLERLADALEDVDGLETHLALPAGLHPADLDRVLARFRPLRPSRLLLTRMDETAAPGAAWNAFRRLGVPVSYVSDGPRTPDDFRAATAADLTARILPAEDGQI